MKVLQERVVESTEEQESILHDCNPRIRGLRKSQSTKKIKIFNICLLTRKAKILQHAVTNTQMGYGRDNWLMNIRQLVSTRYYDEK